MVRPYEVLAHFYSVGKKVYEYLGQARRTKTLSDDGIGAPIDVLSSYVADVMPGKSTTDVDGAFNV